MKTEVGRFRILGVLALALVLAGVLIAMVSAEPLHAFRLLVTGALPDIRWSADAGFGVRRLARFGAVIEETVTLSLLGTAVLFGFRARQFSLGADGQFFLGALAATMASVWLAAVPALALPGAVLASVGTGFLWGLLPGWLKARFGANEIVTTLMLNIVAVQLFRFVVTFWFNDPGANMLVTPTVPAAATLSAWVAHTNVTGFVLLVPLAAGAAWWLIERTTVGFEIRAVGDAPGFAAQVGLPVERAVALSMALGGAFAGLAGLYLSNGLLKRLPVDLTPGIGFEGLMIALLARNQPLAVPLAAFLYACLKAGAQAMERASDVPRELVLVLQACIVLMVVSERLIPRTSVARLAGWWRRRATPVADGGSP